MVVSLDVVYERNAAFRASVARTTGWITATALERMTFAMIPEGYRALLDHAKEVGPTQYDVVSWLGLLTSQTVPLHYLEVGVAVLKGVDTQVHAWRNATIVAFDIESPNPTRASTWGVPTDVLRWPSQGVRREKGLSTDSIVSWPPTYHRMRHNRVFYVTSDAMVPNGWQQLARMRAGSHPFNLVLSDGRHMVGALAYEHEMLSKTRLLARKEDGPLTLIWDDCVYALRHEVETSILPRLQRELRDDLCFVNLLLPGWIGVDNEVMHSTCIVSSLDLSPLLEKFETVLISDIGATRNRGTWPTKRRARSGPCYSENAWPTYVPRPKAARGGADTSQPEDSCVLHADNRADRPYLFPFAFANQTHNAPKSRRHAATTCRKLGTLNMRPMSWWEGKWDFFAV